MRPPAAVAVALVAAAAVAVKSVAADSSFLPGADDDGKPLGTCDGYNNVGAVVRCAEDGIPDIMKLFYTPIYAPRVTMVISLGKPPTGMSVDTTGKKLTALEKAIDFVRGNYDIIILDGKKSSAWSSGVRIVQEIGAQRFKKLCTKTLALRAWEGLSVAGEAVQLASAISTNPCIEKLDLSDNELTAITVSDGFANLEDLTHLDLSGNAITMIEAGAVGNKLQWLDVAGNALTSLIDLALPVVVELDVGCVGGTGNRFKGNYPDGGLWPSLEKYTVGCDSEDITEVRWSQISKRNAQIDASEAASVREFHLTYAPNAPNLRVPPLVIANQDVASPCATWNGAQPVLAQGGAETLSTRCLTAASFVDMCPTGGQDVCYGTSNGYAAWNSLPLSNRLSAEQLVMTARDGARCTGHDCGVLSNGKGEIAGLSTGCATVDHELSTVYNRMHTHQYAHTAANDGVGLTACTTDNDDDDDGLTVAAIAAIAAAAALGLAGVCGVFIARRRAAENEKNTEALL